MRVHYLITGEFYPGMVWEDFVPAFDEMLPHVTITAEPSSSPEIVFDFERDSFPQSVWYDAIVSPELTPKSAKMVLAAINGISPDEIEIVEANVCIALGN